MTTSEIKEKIKGELNYLLNGHNINISLKANFLSYVFSAIKTIEDKYTGETDNKPMRKFVTRHRKSGITQSGGLIEAKTREEAEMSLKPGYWIGNEITKLENDDERLDQVPKHWTFEEKS